MQKQIFKLIFSLIITFMFFNPAFAGDLNLSVAMSMKDVMTELANVYSQASPGSNFKFNFGGSGAIAKQIENGAPADLFFSANTKWMDYLAEKKIINQKDSKNFAYNVLVFAGKHGLKISKMQDLIKLEKISIGSPGSVPAGEYAQKAMQNAGVYTQLEKKLVMAKDVRTCLMYAEQGEVDGSFVYKTDVEATAKNVKILFVVPQNLYNRITYPMALTITGSKNKEAVAFFKFLQSKKAMKILEKHGFSTK